MTKGESYIFGPYQLAPTERRLIIDGSDVELGSRAFDTLVLLVREQGKIVTKQQIMDYVWSGLTVDEANLRLQISSLRRALSGDRKDDKYIKNIPGRGYVFVAPVQSSSGAKPSQAQTVRPVNRQFPNRPEYLVGREQSLHALDLELSACRFMSVVGPGGIGKTTLAIELVHRLAQRFDNDVYYVDLGYLKAADMVLPTLAVGLGYTVQSGDLLQGLASFIAGRRLLLVLDCCEHVVDTVSEVAAVLFRRAPDIHILTTSREPLRAQGEIVHLLDPLELPMEKSELTAAEALGAPTVQLLMRRARSSGYRGELEDNDATKASEICRQLDGNPLAIELAGSRLNTYGFSDLLSLLGGRSMLNWPGRRHEPRHRTLEATLDWSFELLSDVERRVLTRLSVFVGAFTMEAAQAVSTDVVDDRWVVARAIEELVDKSLISIRPEEGANLYRLLDVTRVYVEVKLHDSGEWEQVLRRHAEFYVRHLRNADLSPGAATSRTKANSLVGNIRAALEWCFSEAGDPRLGVDLASVASQVFLSHSMLKECLRWCQTALNRIEEGAPFSIQMLNLQQSLAISTMYALGNVDQVGIAIDRGLEIAIALGEREAELHLLAGQNLFLTRRADFLGALGAAQRFAALAHESQDPTPIITSDWMLGSTYNVMGQQRLALQFLEQGTARAEALHIGRVFYFGYDNKERALIGRAWTSWMYGLPDKASKLAEQVLAVSAAQNHPVSFCISHLYATHVVLWLRELDWAEHLIDRVLDVAARFQLRPYQTGARALKGQLLLAKGEIEAGVALLQDAIEPLQAEQLNIMLTPTLRAFAEGLSRMNKFDAAEAIIVPLIEQAETVSPTYLLPELWRTRAEIMLARGADKNIDVEPCFHKAIARARHDGALAWELRAVNSTARLWIGSGQKGRARSLLEDTLGKFTEGFDTGDLREARALLRQC